jgi:hypothetical protein
MLSIYIIFSGALAIAVYSTSDKCVPKKKIKMFLGSRGLLAHKCDNLTIISGLTL